MKLSEYVVPWLRSAKSYSMDLGEISNEHPDWSRLCLNESANAPSKKVQEGIQKGGEQGNRYHDLCMDLRKKITARYDLKPENITLGNGSSEVIDNMMRLFVNPGQDEEVMLPFPTFSLFNARVAVNGGKQVLVPFQGKDLDYSFQTWKSLITKKTKLMVIVTPNNPTGSFFPDEDLTKILDLGIPTCIDEAYLEFNPERESKTPVIHKYPHVFVMKTLSKAYGLAGVRFGYALAQPELIRYLEVLSLPWNLSQMAIHGAYAALEDRETLKSSIANNKKWMEIISGECRKLGLYPLRASGNFMMIDANDFGMTSTQIFELGMKSGLILKTVEEISGKKGYFRITPGTEEDNKRLIEFLKKTFKK